MMPTPTEVMQHWLLTMEAEDFIRERCGENPDHDLWDAGAFLIQCLEQGVDNR